MRKAISLFFSLALVAVFLPLSVNAEGYDTCALADAAPIDEALLVPYCDTGDIADNTNTNGARGPDIWYAVDVTTVPGALSISYKSLIATGYDTYLYLYSDCTPTQIASNDDYWNPCGLDCCDDAVYGGEDGSIQSALTYSITVPGRYYVCLDTYYTTAPTDGTHCLQIDYIAPPVNDTCASPIDIDISTWVAGGTETFSTTGSTTVAANDYEDYGTCGSGLTSPEVVYSFTPPEDLDLVVDLCGSGYDTIMVITDDCPVPTSVCMFNDDYCGTQSGFACQTYLAGVTYYIFTEGYSGGSGSLVVNIAQCSILPPPPNDLCANAPVSTLADGVRTLAVGTNDGATADCVDISYPVAWEAFEVPAAAVDGANVLVDYCDTTAGWGNVMIALFPCPCDGTYTLASNYTWTCSNGNIEMNFLGLMPGTYYYPILRDESAGAAGAYTVAFTATYLTSCDLTCPSGGTAEGESLCGPDYDDVYNGGCNSTIPIFQDIACGDVICGQSGTFLVGTANSRDTDWYRLELTESQYVTWSIEAEFPSLIFVVDAGSEDCADYVILADQTADQCVVNELSSTLDAGVYWLLVMPSVFTGVDCGADYIASLTCGAPPTPIPFCIGQEYGDTTVVPIDDNSCPTLNTSTIDVADTGTISDVNVRINITHTWVSDLRIYLLAPDGITQVELSTGNGSSGDNYVDTIFNDEAATSITAGIAPFTDSYIPESPLSVLDGMDMNGIWTLQVCDGAGGDTGSIESWDICFETASVPTATPTGPTPTPGPIPTTGPAGIGLLLLAIGALMSLAGARRRK